MPTTSSFNLNSLRIMSEINTNRSLPSMPAYHKASERATSTCASVPRHSPLRQVLIKVVAEKTAPSLKVAPHGVAPSALAPYGVAPSALTCILAGSSGTVASSVSLLPDPASHILTGSLGALMSSAPHPSSRHQTKVTQFSRQQRLHHFRDMKREV